MPWCLRNIAATAGIRARRAKTGLSATHSRPWQRFDDRLPSNGGLVYFGESLGAAVAIATAEQTRPDALILGSPFTSMTDVGRFHYPWLPVAALLRDSYPSLERINGGALDGIPALVIGGTGDRTVPIEQSRQIGAALEASMYEVEHVDHNDSAIRSAPSMVGVVSDFVAAALES